MEWHTIDITPKTDPARTFLTSYSTHREQFMDDLNSERLEAFENEEIIFELDLDLLASANSDIQSDELFFRDISRLLRENGCRWKKKLLELGSDTTVRNTIGEYLSHLSKIGSHSNFHPEIGEQGFHIDSLTDTIHLYPNSASSKEYEYTLQTDSLPSNQEVSAAELQPENEQIVLYTETDAEPEQPEHRNAQQNTLSTLTYLRILGVSHGNASCTQVTISDSQEDTLLTLLDKLNLRWKSPINGTYFVVDSVDKYQEITRFLAQDTSTRSLSSYYSVFDFPVDTTAHITDKIRLGTILNLAGEEVFVYALCNNKISSELAEYATFIQFRPKPTIESIRTALKHTREYEESLQSATQIITEIQSHNTTELYSLYKKEHDVANPWPVLPVEVNILE